MTEIDKEIVRLYSQGYKKKEIAEKLGLTFNVVKKHIDQLRKKGVEVKKWWQ